MRDSLAWRITSFLAALAVLGIAVRALDARAHARRQAQRQHVLERLGDRPVAFLGDSHIECAIDDRQAPRLVNFATGSEHYVFTLAKLRQLRPGVVVIGTWIHNFLPFYQRLVGPVLMSRYEVWMPGLTEGEIDRVRAQLDFELAAFWRARRLLPFVGTRLAVDLAQKRRGLGGFAHRTSGPGPAPEVVAERLEQLLADGTSPFPAPFQADHLSALLAHCRQAGIPVVLLSTPVHAALRSALPASLDPAFRALVARLVEAGGARHWDYAARETPDDAFLDADHLNAAGSAAFTLEVKRRLLDEGLLPR